jgi:hypothetical protein
MPKFLNSKDFGKVEDDDLSVEYAQHNLQMFISKRNNNDDEVLQQA